MGVRVVGMFVLLFASAEVWAGPMPRPEPVMPPTPALPVTRHEVRVVCDAPEPMGAPMHCTMTIALELSEPTRELERLEVRLGRGGGTQMLSPSERSPSGLSLRYETRLRVDAMQYTAAVRDISPVEARHPIYTDRWMAAYYPLSYNADALHSVPVELTLEFPDVLEPNDGWLWLTMDDLGGGRKKVREIDDSYPGFSVGLEETARVALGGPIVGVACPIKSSPEPAPADELDRVHACPAAVLGWEFSYPDWVLYGLRVESDFDSHSAIIPSVETMAWIEDFGFGFLVGLPVELTPDARIGVRLQVTFSTWVFGFGIGADIFPIPALNNQGGIVSTSMNAHLSF